MKLTEEMYSELRESLWQARKHCEESYLDIGPEDSEFIIIPSHGWSHDEWHTAEFAWCLGSRLEVRAIIPTRNDFMRNIKLGNIVGNLSNKNIIELGGIRRKTLEMDSNELNLLRLAYLYFKRRNLNVNLTRFDSRLYNLYLDKFKHYLRIEISQKWRRNFKNSFNFYNELEKLIEIIASLKLPGIDKCRICDDQILDDWDYRRSHLFLRAFRLCDNHSIPFYSIPFLDVISQETLFVNYPVELLEKCRRRRIFRCIICKKKINSDGFCNDCETNHVSFNDIIKLGCLEKLGKNVSVQRRKDPRNDNNSSQDINVKERECVDCRSSFTYFKHPYRIESIFCEECKVKYDSRVIYSDVLSGKFTVKDFINMPELRKQYLTSRDD